MLLLLISSEQNDRVKESTKCYFTFRPIYIKNLLCKLNSDKWKFWQLLTELLSWIAMINSFIQQSPANVTVKNNHHFLSFYLKYFTIANVCRYLFLFETLWMTLRPSPVLPRTPDLWTLQSVNSTSQHSTPLQRKKCLIIKSK